LNLTVMMRLRASDLFIGMSGIYLEAARFAKRWFGAATWLERGSRHILSQDGYWPIVLAQLSPAAEQKMAVRSPDASSSCEDAADFGQIRSIIVPLPPDDKNSAGQ
jgi:hypothetical protein